jgi:hypothetical protein
MQENTYFQIRALQNQHGGQDVRQETKTYKLTSTSKYGIYPYVFEVPKCNGTNENKAILAQNNILNMTANTAACTELKYNKLSYISKLCVESYVLGVPKYNGEIKIGIKIPIPYTSKVCVKTHV